MSKPLATSPLAWFVDDFRDGDETTILELFNTGFGKERSLRLWRWRFAEGPDGGPLASVARRYDDQRVVGCYMAIPFRLSVAGESVPAAQIVDLVVHPDYRKQGMFEQMAKHSYESFATRGFRVELAFPNPGAQSYPGFIRTLSWTRIAELRRFTRRLDLLRPLEQVLRLALLARLAHALLQPLRRAQLAQAHRRTVAATAGLEFRVSTRLPAAYDALWESCRDVGTVQFWKDRAYLEWRYEHHPEERFEYLCLMRGETLAALAVTHARDGIANVCELLVPGGDPQLSRRLLEEAALLAMNRGHRSLQFFAQPGQFPADRVEGFAPAREVDNVLVGRAIGDTTVTVALAHPAGWFLSYGDPDFV